ncbi:MAG: TadE/TadG family type IV pilus assembly protein [Holosporales bacterium]
MIKLKPMLPRFAHNKRGVAAIEAALLLPLFLFFVFALIDVSWTMLRRYGVEQASAQLAIRMRENPTANVASLAGSLGYGLVDFTGTSACMCVTQHDTLNAAASASANWVCPCTSDNTGPPPRDPVTWIIPDYFLGVSASASFAPLSFIGRQFFGDKIEYRFNSVLAFERMPRTCYTVESYSLETPSGVPHVKCGDGNLLYGDLTQQGGFFLAGISASKGTAGRDFVPMVNSPNAGPTHMNCNLNGPLNPTIEGHGMHLVGLQFQNGTRKVREYGMCDDPTPYVYEAPHVMNFSGRCTINRYQYICCSYERETKVPSTFLKPTEKF